MRNPWLAVLCGIVMTGPIWASVSPDRPNPPVKSETRPTWGGLFDSCLKPITEENQDAIAEACSKLVNAAELKPELRALILTQRGSVYLRRGEFGLATGDFIEARGRDEASPGPLWGLVEVYIKQKKFSSADEMLDLVAKVAPQEALQFVLNEKVDGKVLTEADLKSGSAAPLALFRGLSYLEYAQYETALAAIDQALVAKPDWAEARAYRGRALLYLEKEEGALLEFNASLKAKPDFLPALYDRAVVLRHQNKNEAAIADYDHILRADSKSAFAQNWRAVSLYNLGRYEDALAGFDKAVSLDPKYADAYYNRANTYQRLRQHEKAIGDFDKTIALNPNSSFAHNNRGVSYDSLGDVDKAMQDYVIAVRLDGTNALALNNRGRLYMFRKQLDLALADFDEAIKIKPDYAQARHNRALIRAEQKDVPHALEDYDVALKDQPDNPTWLFERAGLLYQQGQEARSKVDLEKAVAVTPEDSGGYVIRARAYLSLRKPKQAEADAEQALVLDPGNVVALALASELAAARNDVPRAIDYVSRAIAKLPDNAALYMQRCQLYPHAAGKADDNLALAQKDCDKAISLAPGNAWFYRERARFFTGRKLYERALADFDKAIALSPDYAEFYLRRGALYRELHDAPKALADFDRATKLDPKFWQALAARGSLFLDQGDARKALVDFDQVLVLNGKDSIEFNNACWARAVANVEIAKALTQCQRAVELGPKNAGAHDSLGMIYFRLGRFAEALKEFEVAISLYPQQMESLYMRGITKRRLGDVSGGDGDIATATKADPSLTAIYAGFGVKP